MKIIGIHDGHNASVSLLDNGKITFALQEERVRNEKNYFGFPEKSLDFLLKYNKLEVKDIDAIVFAGEYMSPPMTKEEFMSHFAKQGSVLMTIIKKISKISFFKKIRVIKNKKRRIELAKKFGFPEEKITFVDHHLCHAAAAYFGLAKDWNKKYLILTLDGGGDWLCSTVNIGFQGKIKKIAETSYGNSLGDIYSRTTFMMGFTPWEHEYKLMGMAPYASKKYGEKVKEIYKKYLDLNKKNPLTFSRKIFKDTNHIVRRLRKDLEGQRFDNICFGLQDFTEELIVKWVRECIKQTGINDLICGGGVFMNVKANKAIAEMPEVNSIEIFPSCGDESNSMGAAWLIYNNRVKENHFNGLNDYYLGPLFSDEEVENTIKKFLRKNNFYFQKIENINSKIAELLADGKIVARCSGRMEFGARALGNRSILADPINQKIVNIINKMIKNRDFWMPFAPIVLKEKSHLYIKNPKNISSPYMMMAFETTDKKDEFIAAIHNADNTARMQILEKGQNQDLEEIINFFYQKTGRAVLLNTSFNLHGHPIVFGPKEAIETFLNSGLEYLVINNFLISKNEE